MGSTQVQLRHASALHGPINTEVRNWTRQSTLWSSRDHIRSAAFDGPIHWERSPAVILR